MRNWKHLAHRLAVRLERRADAAVLSRRRSDAPPEIHPFRGYGTRKRLHVTARVLQQPRLAQAADLGTAWSNLLETFRRLASAEAAGVEVVAEFHGRRFVQRSDDEGYVHFVIEVDRDDLPESLRHEVPLRTTHRQSREAVAEVIVPPDRATLGVISDIDDTIVETNATSLLRMARTVFTSNARGRVAMEGVAEFYRALEAGLSGNDGNPLFYVSSSPWNFYDLLDQFLAINGIPSGPLMLQDYGIDETKLIHGSHDDHKLAQITEILDTYPLLPFILIGDSGQRDPEIYREVALAQRQRIRAIYIRDVTTTARDAQVHSIAQEIERAGVPVVLIAHTMDAVLHARAAGLIR